MADMLHLPYSTYSNYENNNREPPFQIIEKFCLILDIKLTELLNYKEMLEEAELEEAERKKVEDEMDHLDVFCDFCDFCSYLGYSVNTCTDNDDSFYYKIHHEHKTYSISFDDFFKIFESVSMYTKFNLENIIKRLDRRQNNEVDDDE